MSVVVCTDLSGKERHRRVDVDRMMTSGNVGAIIVSTLWGMPRISTKQHLPLVSGKQSGLTGLVLLSCISRALSSYAGGG